MAWAPDYVTTDELKEYIRVEDTVDDTVLALAIAAASRAVDRACHRQFGNVTGAVARIYTPRYDPLIRRIAVTVDDIYDDTGLAVAVDSDADGGFATAMTSFTLRPANAEADGWPWTQIATGPNSTVSMPLIRDGVRVTALFGWADVPDAIKQATLLQASRFAARRNSPYGIAGSPENGSELRLLAKVDPDVAVALEPYRRPKGRFA